MSELELGLDLVGWRVMEARTGGGQSWETLEHECGARLKASARLGDLIDHVCP